MVTVPVELRGECPGAKEGGTFKQVIREVQIECTAQTIPEVAVAHIAHLQAGNVLKVKDLEIPAGTSVNAADEDVIASCLLPGQKVEEASAMGASATEASDA